MGTDFDPELQAGYLRECLAQAKRPIGFFIGAGCPMAVRINRGGQDEPLIPDLAGITAQVTNALKSSELENPFNIVVEHFKTDKRPSPTVEDLLSHIRSLRVVAGNDSVRGVSGKELAELDDKICFTIAGIADCRLPNANTPYHKLAAWIGATERTTPVEVFTTNYDLLLEEALEANRVPYFDGFIGSFKTFFDLQAMEGDKLPSRWARLWKIHGSLNWCEDEGRVHRGSSETKRHLIYPSHLKYDESRRMPYLAMLDRLRTFLRQSAAVLIVCGFSFSDVHLNEVIAQGLQGNPTSIAFAFMYGALGKHARAVELATNRANLNVLAEDEGVIGTKKSKWTSGKPAPSCADTPAVKWIADPADAKKKNATFLLGNFAALSDFAESLIGERQRMEIVPDGK